MLIIRWVLLALTLAFVAWLLPGIHLMGFSSALWAALVIGIINVFIRPILMIITVPINILTLGLFTFILNALLLMLVAHIVPGFIIDGFFSALIGSILISVVSVFINRLD